MAANQRSNGRRRLHTGCRDRQCCLLGIVLVALLTSGAVHACRLDGQLASTGFRLANDAFLGLDNQFTSGLALSRYQALQSRAEHMWGQGLGGALAGSLLPRGGGWCYRHNLMAGQNLQTPDELENPKLNPQDLPYLGMLAWQNSWTAINDEHFVGLGWMLGWVGSAAFGKLSQRTIHKITGNTEPRGWEHQLDNEPLINLYYARKQKLRRSGRWDAAVALDLGIGNFFTVGEIGMEFRSGRRPPGFTPIFGPVGRRLMAGTALHEPGARYLYVSGAVRGVALGFTLPRDGNLIRNDNRWTRSNRLDPKRLLARLEIGLHLVQPHWAAHLQYWLSTRVADGIQANVPAFANSFGLLSIERRF